MSSDQSDQNIANKGSEERHKPGEMSRGPGFGFSNRKIKSHTTSFTSFDLSPPLYLCFSVPYILSAHSPEILN